MEVIRLFVEGTYQELQKACLLCKIASMFAALGALAAAREEAQLDNPNCTSNELANWTFGIARDRVFKQDQVVEAKDGAARLAGRATYEGGE